MGVGIDIAFIPRFENNIKVAERVLAPIELERYNNSKQPATFLAGRFAAKEAFIKAYGPGGRTIDLKTIIITNDEEGAPHLVYEQKTYQVSISHDGEYAIAIVIS